MTALESDLEGVRVLELYAGSGAVGLEALSRGARYCDFVENNPAALHALKANIAALGVRERTRVYKRDAFDFVIRVEPDRYDLVLADPPYGSRRLDHLVARWLEAPFSRILAVEHAVHHRLPAGNSSLVLGESIVTLYRADRDAT